MRECYENANASNNSARVQPLVYLCPKSQPATVRRFIQGSDYRRALKAP